MKVKIEKEMVSRDMWESELAKLSLNGYRS